MTWVWSEEHLGVFTPIEKFLPSLEQNCSERAIKRAADLGHKVSNDTEILWSLEKSWVSLFFSPHSDTRLFSERVKYSCKLHQPHFSFMTSVPLCFSLFLCLCRCFPVPVSCSECPLPRTVELQESVQPYLEHPVQGWKWTVSRRPGDNGKSRPRTMKSSNLSKKNLNFQTFL